MKIHITLGPHERLRKDLADVLIAMGVFDPKYMPRQPGHQYVCGPMTIERAPE